MSNETYTSETSMFAKDSDITVSEIPGRFIDQVKGAFELNSALNALNVENLELGKPLIEKPSLTSMLGGAALEAATALPKQVGNSIGCFAIKVLLKDLKFPIA